MLNRVWTVLANRCGAEGTLVFTGRSMLITPRGEIRGEAPAEGERVHLEEIDPAEARDKMVTPRNHLLRDRRPEFYRDLVEGSPP
jgi:predicted amidohydrolase